MLKYQIMPGGVSGMGNKFVWVILGDLHAFFNLNFHFAETRAPENWYIAIPVVVALSIVSRVIISAAIRCNTVMLDFSRLPRTFAIAFTSVTSDLGGGRHGSS